jgi:hypothetical protein
VSTPDPVRVATARHQSEADLIESILKEAGIPALVRRSGGFDVPDFLAAGPRDILVPASAAERARDILADVSPADPLDAPPRAPQPPLWTRSLAVAAAVLIVALLAGLAVALFV